MIELRPVTEDNFQDCIRLNATVEKESFVDPVVYSLAEAWLYYDNIKPYAVYLNDKVIGFISLYVGENNPQIINLMIDDAFQNSGYGTLAAQAGIRVLKSEFEASRISVPVDLDHALALRFWEKLGFAPSDNVEDGYVFLRLYLS